LTVVLSICANQLSRVYLLAFKCSCCNKDCQIPKRVRDGLAATDSDYLKCNALLAALHFPLETTSFLKVNAIVAILFKETLKMQPDVHCIGIFSVWSA